MDDESSSDPPHSTLLALTEGVGMNGEKTDLVFGNGGNENPTKDTNGIIEGPAEGKYSVMMIDEESTLILDHEEKEDFTHGGLDLGVEEGGEYVTDNRNDEETENDMIDQGNMKEGEKNEEFPKEAGVVIGDEQEKENIMVEVKPYLFFGRGGKENPTEVTNEIIEGPAEGKESVMTIDEESTLILDREEKGDFTHGDLDLGVEEGEEHVTNDTNGEESEDDIIDQGDVNEEGKNEEFPKEADAATGNEQDRENIVVEVDPEENEDKLANEVVKPDLVFGNGGKENPTKDTNEIIEGSAQGKESVMMIDEESTLILDHEGKEDFTHDDLDLGVEEREEYVTDNTSGEESEDDMIDQGDEEGKNEEFPKEADVVTGDEQDRENIMVEVDPEENEDRVANGEVKRDSKNIGKLRKRKRVGKKKRGLTVTNDVDSKTANNKASLGNRMSKMDKSMGMIFMCNSKTKKDCYRHKVFGLPAGKKEMVLKIKYGMKLFLFNSDLKLLYGIYKAAGPGGYNIEPKAFGCGFPSQVRFEVSEDCVPLPEEKFKRVIKDNYYQKNKFDFQLTSEQVKNLCKLFRATSKGSRLHGIGKAETHALMDRERNRNECYKDRSSQSKRSTRNVDHRVEPYRNLDQDWMARNRPHREVPYRNVDQDRRAREMYRDQEKHHTPARDILYEESRDPYKRDPYKRVVNASRMVALPLRPRLSPVTATVLHPPSYSYGEEMNAYRRDPLYEDGRGLFFDLESRRREQIERRVVSLPQHHDRPFLDAEFRHHQVIERHDHQVLYRPILNEPSYAATPREYHTTRYAPYHTNLQPEYRPSRPAYRY